MLWKHILLAAATLGVASAKGGNGDGGNPSAMNGQMMSTMSGPMGAQTPGAKHKGGKGGGGKVAVPADLSGGFKVEEITLEIKFAGKSGKKKGGKGGAMMSGMATGSGMNAQPTKAKGGKGEGGKEKMSSMMMNGMSPTGSGMMAMQTGKSKKGGKGKGLTMQETMQTPTFALGKANGTSAQSMWIIIMVDTTSSSNRVLHYVHSDYKMTGSGKTISSSSQPQMPWKGPGTLGDMGGQRQYTVLMYPQNGTFTPKGMPQMGQSVNMQQFVQQNGLQKAVAGKSFAVNAQANGTSTGGAGQPAETSSGSPGSSSPAAGAGSSLRAPACTAVALGAVVALGMALL